MLKFLTSARSGLVLFPMALLAFYALLPAGLAVSGLAPHPYFGELARVSAVAAGCILLVVLLPVPVNGLAKVAIRPEHFLLLVWAAFGAFVLVACVTAERIPLVAALTGADAPTIAILREKFLKAREGWQAGFVYLNALLAGFLVPYSLALMFLHRFRLRWVCFGLFLLYTLSFAEKGFFLKAVLPIFYLILQQRIKIVFSPALLIGGMLALLGLVTVLSRVGTNNDAARGQFFTTSYVAGSQADYMLWRAVAIPVVTAADAVRVYHEQFNGRPLHGATSSLLARVAGSERVYYERLVFAAQWGQNATGTGSANSVFVTEAYVNFGYAGVVVFAVAVGLILRLLAFSRDEAFESLWLLFALNIAVAGLLGTLLSNGFLLLLGLAACVRFKGALPAGQKPPQMRPAVPAIKNI